MQRTQNLVVKPNGRVKGGTASFTIDNVNGVITYQANINVTVIFWPHTYSTSGQYVVDPKLVRSDYLKSLQIGDVLTLGDVTFTVLSIATDSVTVAISVPDQQIGGTAIVDTTQPIIGLTMVSANANVDILGALIIEADAVDVSKR